jgi:hypothetical protein
VPLPHNSARADSPSLIVIMKPGDGYRAKALEFLAKALCFG